MPNFLTTILVMMGTVLGVTIAFTLTSQYHDVLKDVIDFAEPRIVLGILFGGTGYLIASTAAWEFQRWFEKRLPNMRIRNFLWGGAGFVLGLIVANLLMIPILILMLNKYMASMLTQNTVLNVVVPVAAIIVPLGLNFCLGYVGMTVFIRKQNELVGIFTDKLKPTTVPGADLKIIDTSAIIDGRILDLLPSNILEGRLLVPLFVLNELHLISDSSDQSKRNRGKRGFEILERLKEIEEVQLDFPQIEYPDIPQVDTKLIEYAKETGGKIITNDFALNKLAKLQEIMVINLNEVSNALRPVVLSGEKMEIRIVKKGKGPRQGIGYLNDGTMVVVQEAAGQQGETCTVTVTSIQQSSVGRMIFATLDKPDPT